MINIKELYFAYNKDIVISNFNYSFADFGMYSIIGESGSGKTTLLNLIGGLLKPDKGSITYSDSIKNIKDSTAYIFQDNNLFDNLTVYENIVLLTSFKSNVNDNDIDLILDKLGVLKYKNKKVEQISGGERQRVSIAIALLMDKKIIIADEPLASLDYTNSNKILTFLKEISANKLVIFTSHNVDILNDYCDEIINIETPTEMTNDIQNLEYPVETGVNLSLKKFLYVFRKVLNKKRFIKIVACIFLALCISVLSVTFSVSQISLDKVLKEELTKEVNSPALIIPNPEMNSTIESYLKENNLNYYESYRVLGTQLGFGDNYNNHIFVVIDNELSDFEVSITDEVFVDLRDFGFVRTNLSFQDAKGTVFEIPKNDWDGNNFKLEIRDVIDTRKRYLNENGKYKQGSWVGFSDRIYMNFYTYFSLAYSDYDMFEFKYSSVDKQERGYFHIKFKNDLELNQIALGSKGKNSLERIDGRQYDVGDILQIDTFNINDTNYSIKEISDELDDTDFDFIYFSTKILSNCLSFNSLFAGQSEKYYSDLYEIHSAESSQIIKMRNDLKENLGAFHRTNTDDEVLNVIFEGAYDAFEYYTSLRGVFIMSNIVLVLFGILTILFAVYYAFSNYSMNKNKFMILKLYGMNKSNELYLIEFDVLIIMAFSLVISTVLYYLNCIFLKNSLIEASHVAISYNLFNMGYELISFLIILILMFFLFFICYIISLKRKVKTHIGI